MPLQTLKELLERFPDGFYGVSPPDCRRWMTAAATGASLERQLHRGAPHSGAPHCTPRCSAPHSSTAGSAPPRPAAALARVRPRAERPGPDRPGPAGPRRHRGHQAAGGGLKPNHHHTHHHSPLHRFPPIPLPMLQAVPPSPGLAASACRCGGAEERRAAAASRGCDWSAGAPGRPQCLLYPAVYIQQF